MLTRAGWLVVAAAALQLVAGRLLGVLELIVTGVATGTAVVASVVFVWASGLRLDVRREISPPKVHAGTPSTVELRIHNAGRHTTPVLLVHDRVTGTRGVSMMLAPLLAGEEAPVAYRLPTDRRGVLGVGPLVFELSDPFGLARTRTPAASSAELTVFPRIDSVVPIPHTTGDDPHAGADHPNALGRSGEDFYALRQYVVGDDLRRVHWPSTARHDELMVRQDELPWQSRATILLDTRSVTADDDVLELLISAAASLVHASSQRQDLVRLVTAEGTDSGFATGRAAFEAIMEHLATLQASHLPTLGAAEAVLRTSTVGGALVVLVGERAERTDLDALSGLRSRFGSLLVVQAVRDSRRSAPDPVDVLTPALLRFDAENGFAAVWNAAFTPSAARMPVPTAP